MHDRAEKLTCRCWGVVAFVMKDSNEQFIIAEPVISAATLTGRLGNTESSLVETTIY